VFLSNAGEPLPLDYLTEMVRGYVDAAEIGKRGACHLFRHTMATLMLEGGADIRFIQAMLGHADLKTAQIYTHVAIRQLQEIHRATHPAKLERDKREIEEKLEAEEGTLLPCWRKCGQGAEIVVEEGYRTVAVIKQVQGPGRPLDECIALAKAHGSGATLDEEFAQDL